jgi:hypothetical protein
LIDPARLEPRGDPARREPRAGQQKLLRRRENLIHPFAAALD